MKLRPLFFLIEIIIISLALTNVINVQPTENTVTPIKVGIFAPYPSASALSIYGGWTVQGFQLGLIYATGGTNMTADGRPFELHYYDTLTGAVDIATLATNAIENDGIDILVGGTSSAVAASIQAVASQYHKIYFITPGADTSLTGSNFNQYSFRLARNSYQDAIVGIKYAWESTGARNFSIIAPGYSFGYSGAQAMQQEISKRGGTTVDTIYVPLGTTDFNPYMNALLSDETNYGVDMLIVIWAGSGFNYLYAGLDDYNISSYMNISSGVIDTPSMDYIQTSMSTGSLIGQTGSAVYGYKLANNSVNDWLVNESITRGVTPDYGYPGSASNVYAMDFSDIHVPELFTPDGFSTAQFMVAAANKVTDLNSDQMICTLEGMSLLTPKGNETIRTQDHQGLAQMYIATIVNDTQANSPTYGHLIGKLVQTYNSEDVAPPIDTTYTGCTVTQSTQTSSSSSQSIQSSSISSQSTQSSSTSSPSTQSQASGSKLSSQTTFNSINANSPGFVFSISLFSLIVVITLRRRKHT